MSLPYPEIYEDAGRNNGKILIDQNGCFRIELFGGTTLSELVVVVYNKQMKKGGKKKEQKWGARNSESCYFSRNKHISIGVSKRLFRTFPKIDPFW